MIFVTPSQSTTVALTQGNIDTARRVEFAGDYPQTAALTVSTIGQEIDGHGQQSFVEQQTNATNGINLRTGATPMVPGGVGTYFNGVSNFQLSTANTNTGVGLSVGDPTEDTHNGDYCFFRKLYLTNYQVGVHLHSMAMSLLDGLVVNGGSGGAKGFVTSGGSNNSHIWIGVTAANYEVGISWESQGFGHVIMPWDLGGTMDIGIDFTAAAQMSILGGNLEASIATTGINLAADCVVTVIGTGGQGTRANEAIRAADGNGRLVRIGSRIGTQAGVMQVQGAGYGNTMALYPTYEVDTTYDGTVKWKDLPFGSLLYSGLESRFSVSTDRYGAVAHIIRDTGPGGLFRMGKSAAGTAFRKSFCNDIPDGTFTLTAGVATVSNTSITANSVVVPCIKTVGGTVAGQPYVDTITPGTGFTVAGGGGSNTSTYNYYVLEIVPTP